MDALGWAIVVMALVTYGLRALPLVLVQRPVEHPFLTSFLHYVPYAVLTAMTIPAILFATSSVWSGAAGLVAAVLLARWGRSLLTVALGAASAVWLVEVLVLGAPPGG